jgi:hypothetical protein
MSDTQRTLERELERLSPPRIPFDRLVRRRDRRRRNQRIRAGVLGIAIAIAVGWLGVNANRRPRGRPIPRRRHPSSAGAASSSCSSHGEPGSGGTWLPKTRGRAWSARSWRPTGSSTVRTPNIVGASSRAPSGHPTVAGSRSRSPTTASTAGRWVRALRPGSGSRTCSVSSNS